MPLDAALENNREAILRLAAQHGARNVRVFGSASRGETGPESDLDFLVDLDPERSLLDLGSLFMELQDLLGRKVDLVTEKALHWYIRDRVLSEATPL